MARCSVEGCEQEAMNGFGVLPDVFCKEHWEDFWDDVDLQAEMAEEMSE